eukprot:gene9812-11462_t
MFFNAMKRKNYSPKEEDMNVVIAIHNTVNEKCWEHVMEWEADYKEAKDFSPKARFLNFIGYTLPFDRHDWTVDRCGKKVRYIIDFYEGKVDKESNKPIGIYLDVRPAIDDWQSLKDRVNRLFK